MRPASVTSVGSSAVAEAISIPPPSEQVLYVRRAALTSAVFLLSAFLTIPFIILSLIHACVAPMYGGRREYVCGDRDQ